MRCDCCDRNLSDYECSLKSVSSGDYMNTCVKCLTGLNIPVTGNGMLKKKLDEAESTYDEWNEHDDYDVEIQYDDCCIDYTLTQDDEDETSGT